MRVPSGTSTHNIYFVAVDATDFVTRETGLASFTVVSSRHGGADNTYTTPTVTEIDAAAMPGVYSLLIDEDTTIGVLNDTEEYCVHITHAGMAPVTRTIELYRPKATIGRQLGLAADGHVLETDLLAGHTAQTADHTAAIAAIPTTAMRGTDNAALASVCTETRLQALTDWLNGGRLDLILDIIAADTTTDIPALIAALNDLSAAQVNAECDTALADYDAVVPADLGMPQINVAFSNIEFLMVLTSDHVTPATGLTVTGERSIDGGAFTAVGGAIAEVSDGIYQFDAAQADMNGTIITFRFSSATADDTFLTIKTRP